MGFGILEDSKLEHVPGTSYVLDDNRIQEDTPTFALKYDTSGKDFIILVPQPSDDPNDPLVRLPLRGSMILPVSHNMPRLADCVETCRIGRYGAEISSYSFFTIYFAKDFTHIALLTGYHLCGCGVAGVLFVASARVWGKRHLFLLGTLLLITSSFWAGRSRSYASLLWARILQGVAVAPFEALVNAVVGDMYFVHERGKRMALSNLSLFGGAFFTPVIVGKMTSSLGWPWPFYFVAIFSTAIFPLVFFLVPETAYKRSSHLNTDLSSTENLHARGHTDERSAPTTPEQNTTVGGDNSPGAASMEKQTGADTEDNRLTHPTDVVPPQKVSFAKSLLPFNGRKTDENFFKLLFRPFPLFFHPAVFYACLIQGTLIGWTVLIGVVLAAIFLGPPLFFTETETGYMYSGPFIGAVLGFIVAGLLSDWSAKYMTRKNKGIYEPEFRLILVFPQLVIGCIGLYGFGITGNNVYKYGWFWPEFFFTLEVMGMVLGAVASALYIVDAHRDIAVEVFTCLLMFKNFFSFGLTWTAYDWLLKNGIVKTFMIIASIQVVVCLLTIPMYIFGKRNRSFFHRHNILKLTRLY